MEFYQFVGVFQPLVRAVPDVEEWKNLGAQPFAILLLLHPRFRSLPSYM